MVMQISSKQTPGHSRPKRGEEIVCAFRSSGGNSCIVFTLGLRAIVGEHCGLA